MCSNIKNMRSYICFLLLIFTSCAVPKPYNWNGKKVSEKKYNKKLINYTRNYLKKSPINLSGFNLSYDTTKSKN